MRCGDRSHLACESLEIVMVCMVRSIVEKRFCELGTRNVIYTPRWFGVAEEAGLRTLSIRMSVLTLNKPQERVSAVSSASGCDQEKPRCRLMAASCLGLAGWPELDVY